MTPGGGWGSESVARGENRILHGQQEVGNRRTRDHDSAVVDNRIKVHPDPGGGIQQVRDDRYRHCGYAGKVKRRFCSRDVMALGGIEPPTSTLPLLLSYR